ncbi:MAG TPA: cyclic nucleotide-binding domain-containing protein [Thermoanaerobaculia bacterium]|nr:cyclic nucleotide-binding domain-containing protein [Thermoanaerobaculia bacterium]
MALKSWFQGVRGKTGPHEYTIDDLIVLERYDEAAERLVTKLKDNPQDLHSHLKLAEVYTELRQIARAVIEYSFVADEYAQDGFYDKGIALLSKAIKLAPGDTSLGMKLEDLQNEKSMEHVRSQAIEGLRQAGGEHDGTSALELQRLWHHLASSALVRNLPGEQLRRLFSAMELVHFQESAVVVEEGSLEQYLLLLVRGVVDAMSGEGRDERDLLRSFTGGDIIGEGALLERTPWPATYHVREAVIALKLNREGLEKCLIGNPDPRVFIEMLREQRNDRAVASTVQSLRGGS